MNRRFLKIGAALVVVALLGAACSSGGDDSSATDTTVAPTDHTQHGAVTGSPVSTGAAELQAGLTSLLQEHVYLAGAAIATAVGAGGDLEAPAVVSAVETLDANSVALSEAVASVYGAEAGEQFLELWRRHIGFFVDYTLGGATGDQAMQDAAKAQLDAYRADFGAFIDSATGGNLPADAVAESLQMHVSTLITAIDAVLAGSPEVFPALREAAQHMPSTALALSAAIAAQFPDKFPG